MFAASFLLDALLSFKYHVPSHDNQDLYYFRLCRHRSLLKMTFVFSLINQKKEGGSRSMKNADEGDLTGLIRFLEECLKESD